jgi:hypothetical protein
MIGLGTAIEVNDGVADSFLDIPGLTQATPPNDEIRETESKRLGPAVVIRVPTKHDPGVIQFQYETEVATFNRLNLLKGLQPDKTWKIRLNTGQWVSVSGFLKINRMLQITAEEIVTAECEVRLNTVFAAIQS